MYPSVNLINRLKIRSLEANDLSLLVQIETDTSNLIYSGLKEPPDIDDLVTLIQDESAFAHRMQKRFTIVFEGTAIGFVDLFDARLDLKCCYVGIIVISEMQRKGIGLCTLSLLQNEALKLGINNLLAKCMLDNIASINLFQKAGYKIKTSTAEFVVLQNTFDL